MDYSKKILNLLNERGYQTREEIDKFLNPSISDFYSPFLFNDMQKVVDRINLAILNKENVVIYGDYDCDGISSEAMLSMFLTSRGLNPIVFIPNRHLDGYGLSLTSCENIINKYNPSLIITVDTGITAVKEIEYLKANGVDVIVTDHHEPQEILPDCLIIDPKIKSQDYPFDGLSGAGVVLKLIQAMSSVEESLNYIDICAISTIGDIVPLKDENRLITILGLEKINSKEVRPSIKYLKTELKMPVLTSTDVAFKIVPRLNACGRMTSADKCYEFLVEKNPEKLQELYKKIDLDNQFRLKESAEAMERINKSIREIDLVEEPALFVKDNSINLGVIGIIASRLSSTFMRPVFVFTEDADNNLKASIRTIESINIFEIITKFKDLLVEVGGHSFAGGLTIKKDNYEKFKSLVLNELKALKPEKLGKSENDSFDLEIDPRFISNEFYEELNKLEPFGCDNPKPIFKLSTNSTDIVPLKSFRHYKINLGQNASGMLFFGEKMAPIFSEKGEKEIFFNLEQESFKGKKTTKAIIKSINFSDYNLKNESELFLAWHISHLLGEIKDGNRTIHHYSDITEIENAIQEYGSMIIVSNKDRANKLSKQFGLKISPTLAETGESLIIYNPYFEFSFEDSIIYHNIVLDCGIIDENEINNFYGNIYINKRVNELTKFISRDILAKSYKAIKQNLPISANSVMEVSQILSKRTGLPIIDIISEIIIGGELGFFEITKNDGIQIALKEVLEKKSLEESKIYNLLKL